MDQCTIYLLFFTLDRRDIAVLYEGKEKVASLKMSFQFGHNGRPKLLQKIVNMLIFELQDCRYSFFVCT